MTTITPDILAADQEALARALRDLEYEVGRLQQQVQAAQQKFQQAQGALSYNQSLQKRLTEEVLPEDN